jgi:hypothetical protein
VVLRISPNQGETGSGIPILALSGQYFQLGATAQITNGINSINLAPSTVVSPTLITGTLDLSAAAGGPWDVMVTNPDLQWGIATNTLTVTIPSNYSYPITSTCNISVANCLSGTNTPDSNAAEIAVGGVITLDFGIGNGIMDGRGYDFVFYEWYNDDCTCVQLDWIEIELSEDGEAWYTVFNWGDGYDSPMDDSTNIVSYSQDGEEEDNEHIPISILYGIPPNPPHPSGILIDINFLANPPDTRYRYVRLSCPVGGDDVAQVDSIERLH